MDNAAPAKMIPHIAIEVNEGVFISILLHNHFRPHFEQLAKHHFIYTIVREGVFRMGTCLSYRNAKANESWPKTYTIDVGNAVDLVQINCEADNVSSVQQARRDGSRVRARGSLYSWPDLVTPAHASRKKRVLSWIYPGTTKFLKWITPICS